MIQGVNNDDPSTESNGAGKSSIVDALCWGLYGTTARGVSGDAVVNKTAKKNCCVRIFIEDGGEQFVVERYRKDAKHKNQLFVWKRDPDPANAALDLSKGTDRETQEVLTKIIGCSLDVFMAAVYAGQERMPDLPGMTDKQLKMLIEEAAGVEVLAEAYAKARDRYNKQSANIEALNMTRTQAINLDMRLRAELSNLETEADDFEVGRRQRAKDELAKTLPLQKEIAEAESALATWDETAIREELAVCGAKLTAQKEQEVEYGRLSAEVSSLSEKVAGLRSTLLLKKRDLEQMEKGLRNIEAMIGKPCGECGKTYCEHDLEDAKKARLDAIEALRASMVPMAHELKAAQEALAVAQETASTFKAGMTDVSAVAKRQIELTGLLNTIAATQARITTKKGQIDNIKAAASAKLTEINPWTKAIESKKAEIKSNQDTLATIESRLEKATEEAALLADAVQVFGPAGVRAHILDTVTPYLNERTQEYLGALADGNIHAVWATLTKTAKGDLKEKFSIEVTNDKGAESFAGLSGGEKRKVRLATALALQDMVASRATKPIDLFVGDEIDDALDEAGLERLMTVLDRKAKERGTVLVISHNSLGDWIPNVITVTKTGGFATVSGAVERGF